MTELGAVSWPPARIRTERLVLRAPEGRDRASYIELLASPEVHTYLGGPAGRYSMIRTGPFPRGSQWATLVAAVESSLRLHRHQPGTLPDLSGYLHQRTGGMIGSLLWLIRSAAIQAVIDGTEKITRTSMDTIPVDIASQEDGGRARRHREHP